MRPKMEEAPVPELCFMCLRVAMPWQHRHLKTPTPPGMCRYQGSEDCLAAKGRRLRAEAARDALQKREPRCLSCGRISRPLSDQELQDTPEVPDVCFRRHASACLAAMMAADRRVREETQVNAPTEGET